MSSDHAGSTQGAPTHPDRRNAPGLWGSDPIAELLGALGIPYVALTPGASFRGLHDSLVNHVETPKLVLCVHEESAVALAHGYAKVTGKPLAVALHSNVGLMHATMAIFNAWCDRVPILMIGAQGPMDAARRRPWIDWIHTARDLGALIRGYVKWDDQPASVAASLEAVLRAWRIATTSPPGPTYVCLDLALQEQKLPDEGIALPPLHRFSAPEAASVALETAATIARALGAAARPVILVGRVSPDRAAWDRRVALAERTGARVLTDLKNGARFPTRHPCHAAPPGLSLTMDGARCIREADVILSLDWIDLGGTLKLSCGGAWPEATVIQCSLDQYVHNGWSMDHQILPPSDLTLLADPDRLVAMVLDALGDAPARAVPAPQPSVIPAAAAVAGGAMGVAQMAHILCEELADTNPCWIRLPIGWPSEACDFDDPLDYLGYDGAGGIGSGPGMAVGAALALRGTDRLPVAVIGDGDCLMGLTALWTAANQRIPLLVVVANNRSFFNDELHQERVARVRGRPIENRSIGLKIDDPAPDFAKLAEGQGAVGIGPARDAAELREAVRRAVAVVRAGGVAVIDAHVAAEYAREASAESCANSLDRAERPAMHATTLFDVRGFATVITGGAGGIGQAYAEVMLDNGARVRLLDRDAERLDAVVARLQPRGEVDGAVVDVSDRTALRAAIDAAAAHFGRLDVVFANAGIDAGPGFLDLQGDRDPAGALENIPDALWDRVMATNLASVLATIQAAAVAMKRQGSGRIIVTASIGGLRPAAIIGSAYGVSKAAVNHLVRQAALELARYGVQVNAILPGPFLTPLTTPELETVFARGSPTHRVAPTDEIQGVALFLASPASRYVTGTHMVIDGGAMLGRAD